MASTLTNKARGKLAPKFCRPFLVLARIGLVAYKLALTAKYCIHDVFLVMFLNKFMAPILLLCLVSLLLSTAGWASSKEDHVPLSQPWCVGNFGAMDGSICYRCDMGEGSRVQGRLPFLLVRG
jgi:hypothetical protein